ncbi:MAG: hypothetical protein AAF988_01420 [Pseudomonadota bacterium]
MSRFQRFVDVSTKIAETGARLTAIFAGEAIGGAGIYALNETFQEFANHPEAYAFPAVTIPIGIGLFTLGYNPRGVFRALDRVI